jgi:hypothetical protein
MGRLQAANEVQLDNVSGKDLVRRLVDLWRSGARCLCTFNWWKIEGSCVSTCRIRRTQAIGKQGPPIGVSWSSRKTGTIQFAQFPWWPILPPCGHQPGSPSDRFPGRIGLRQRVVWYEIRYYIATLRLSAFRSLIYHLLWHWWTSCLPTFVPLCSGFKEWSLSPRPPSKTGYIVPGQVLH